MHQRAYLLTGVIHKRIPLSCKLESFGWVFFIIFIRGNKSMDQHSKICVEIDKRHYLLVNLIIYQIVTLNLFLFALSF